MFCAVIRGDLSKALLIADVEPKSTANPSTESAKGQVRYISRPNPTAIQAYLDSQSLVATAAAIIAACNPVGGPVNIAPTTIRAVAVGLAGASDAQVVAIQNLLAYKFVETGIVKKSYLYGNLAGFRSASFNPDSRRSPALSNGAAIAMVQDDGSTPYAVLPPNITTADLGTPGPGALRISGTGFLGWGMYETSVILTGIAARRLTQAQILAAGGTIVDTQINIPASIIPGLTLTTSSARVQVNNILSPSVALT